MEPFLEKRESERYHEASPIIVSYFNTGEFHSARSLNYSSGGIYFEIESPLRLGTDVYIRREKSLSDQPVQEGCRSVTLARVKWCKEISDRSKAWFGIGAQYYEPFY